MADAGIKLTDDVFQDIVVENRTNILVGVKLSGTGTGYLKNFLVKNVTTEYPLSNPAGVIVKQDLSGISDTWVDSCRITSYNVCYTKLLRGLSAIQFLFSWHPVPFFAV